MYQDSCQRELANSHIILVIANLIIICFTSHQSEFPKLDLIFFYIVANKFLLIAINMLVIVDSFLSPLASCFSRLHEFSRFPLTFFTSSRVSSLYYSSYISVALLIFLRPLVSRNDYSIVRFWKTSSSFCNHVCMLKQHVSPLTPLVPGLRV